MTPQEVIARRTLTAMVKSGSIIHGFSLVVLGGTALLAAIAIRAPGRPGAGWVLLAGALLAALVATYFAVRVRIDADVLSFLDETGAAGEESGEREAGVASAKAAVPSYLAKGMGKSNPADPLDAHRRSVKLLLRQAVWTIVQTLLYAAAVFFLR